MKIFKIQKILSIIPYFSTYFIIFVTMFLLKRFHASIRQWLVFYGICFVFLTGGGFIIHFFSETEPIVAHLLNIPLFTVASFNLIHLQKKTFEKTKARDGNT